MANSLRPNWLAEQMTEVASDYALAFAPGDVTVALLRDTVFTPLGEDDARRLRTKLSDRYRAWTGRDLGEDLCAEPSP